MAEQAGGVKQTLRKVVLDPKIDAETAKENAQLASHDHVKLGNKISTGKYTLLTFVPKNLFEQFQRVANCYFLFQLCLQLYEPIASLDWQSTFVPLVFVLSVTAAKDGYDDYKRHRMDKKINNLKVRRWDPAKDDWEAAVKWYQVRCGDIIQIRKNEPIPADCVLLQTDSDKGECFVETKDLDGETNLKRRETHTDIPRPAQGLAKDAANFKVLKDETFPHGKRAELEFDFPNNDLEKFQGTLQLDGQPNKIPLMNKNLLLRGCTLRNSEFAIGIVVYAGHDSKVMKNSGAARFKRTHIDKQMNVLVLVIFGLLIFFAALGSIINATWLDEKGTQFHVAYNWYYSYTKNWEDAEGNFDLDFNKRENRESVISVLNFLAYIIVMNTLIPISLYVSIEFIRLGQSLLISFDPLMWDPKAKAYAAARSTTLSEELGQIDYIFSDKTGTLTANVMVFKKCCVKLADGTYQSFGGDSVDEQIRDIQKSIDASPTDSNVPMLQARKAQLKEQADAAKQSFKSGAFPGLTDRNVPGYVNNQMAVELRTDGALERFFRLMAVCHTVVKDKESGEYQAESPDEKALVDAARDCGYEFQVNLDEKMTISINGQAESFEVHEIMEFNSTRKRMSILVRDVTPGRPQQYRLYSKGADSIMFDRLSAAGESEKEGYNKQLDVYARTGLRTLVMAQKNLTDEDFNAFNEQMQEEINNPDSQSLEDRKEALYDSLERDLDIVGASAIEDKLQENVPETIQVLKDAGIKVWVLTGDKLETAVNIGMSCNLLQSKERETLFEITGVDGEGNLTQNEVSKQLYNGIKEMQATQKRERNTPEADRRDFAIVVTGPALSHVLAPSPKEKKEDHKNHTTKGKPLYWTEDMFKQQDKVKQYFLTLAKSCRAVLCCRVSPLQKAKVVDCVKTDKKENGEDNICLAIGDGANDVSMIKTAHVGVGISGLEGRQAVLASDYSIGEFQFLARLLLVHGRWSYYRMCVFLRYFFYKNLCFTIAQFWFAIYNGGSAMTDFDDLYISFFNVVFASAPPIAVAIFEQDVSATMAFKYPILYQAGPKNVYFSYGQFFMDLFRGFVHSILLFFTVVCAVTNGGGFGPDGLDQGDYTMFCMCLAFSNTIIVNLQLAIEIKHWTWVHWLSIAIGPLAWFFLFGITYGWVDDLSITFVSAFYGAFARSMNNPQFWAASVLAIAVTTLPTFMYIAYKAEQDPTPMHIVRKSMLQWEKDEKEKNLGTTRKSIRKDVEVDKNLRNRVGSTSISSIGGTGPHTAESHIA